MVVASAKPPLLLGSDTFRRAAFHGNHPLNSIRHSAVMDLIRIMDWLPADQYREVPAASFRQLGRFHDRRYLQALQYADSEGRVDSDVRERYQIGTFENPLFQGLFERAATTVGGSILAAELALAGHVTFHPSGGTHHGRANRACGFCYFNDPVFAILTFLDAGLQRVMYIDLDAHHGDGVEEAFFGDDRVDTLSLHEANRWPHSGTESCAEAAAWNLPVPAGFNDTELDYLVKRAILPLATQRRPEALVICCGADCLKADPLSRMMLSNTALWRTVRALIDLGLPTVVVGGGGYNPWTVSRYWAGLWATIAGYDIPAALPDEAREVFAGMSSDLIDEEDIDPIWLTSMSDTPYPGPLRSDVVLLAEKLSEWTGEDGRTYGMA